MNEEQYKSIAGLIRAPLSYNITNTHSADCWDPPASSSADSALNKY